jgi:polyisoprenyl-phosphate glycosyltransferase
MIDRTDNDSGQSVRAAEPVLSVIVPVFNEESALPHTYKILSQVLDGLGKSYEVVVMDNGSTDKTESIMQDIAARRHQWKYVRLSRNFGYQNSITAGMSLARGEAIVVIDADLQDPPEMIAEFLKRWEAGYEIVYGVRSKRTGEPRIRIWATMQAMRLISWLSDYPLPLHSGDFRLISRRVRDAFVTMPENSRYVRGMIHWLGYKQLGLPYTRRGRQFGEAGRQWGPGIISLFGFTMNAIFSFSLKPLRLFSVLGGVILIITILAIPVYLVLLTTGRTPPSGFATLLFFSIFNLGVTALGTGILGEYLGRTYVEVKRRPLWLVDYTLNLEQPAATPDQKSLENA